MSISIYIPLNLIIAALVTVSEDVWVLVFDVPELTEDPASFGSEERMWRVKLWQDMSLDHSLWQFRVMTKERYVIYQLTITSKLA